MNRGTIIRTVFFIITMLNASISQIGDVDFGNANLNMVYHVISVVLSIIAGAIALYYNNDFTAEAVQGTQLTRRLKEEHKDD